MGLKHFFKSPKSDPVDSTIVGATKWNQDHYFLDTDGVTPIGAVGDIPYRGTGGLVTLLAGAAGVLTSAGSGNVPAWTVSPSLTNLTLSGLLNMPVGSAGAPSFANALAPTYGLYFPSGNASIGVSIAGTLGFEFLNTPSFVIHQVGSLQWGSSGVASPDLSLSRLAADVLMQARGTNAQQWRLYNTVSGGDSEYFRAQWAGNTLYLGTGQSGSGAARDVAIGPSGAGNLYLLAQNAGAWRVGSDGHLTALGAYDIGDGAGNSPVTIYAEGAFVGAATSAHIWAGRTAITSPGTSQFIFADNGVAAGVGLDVSTDKQFSIRDRALTGGAWFNLLEMTAPSAPAANQVVIYAVDNGGGKTQLMALFSSGAAQQIAIQP